MFPQFITMCAGFIGYRMAAECARDALLQRVVDNKENAGDDCWL